ncbi:MAG: hypothetical protein QNJ37_22390 [Crocosphaera sp.]|nr:hypothetical protein [Crocosphaera sp.]
MKSKENFYLLHRLITKGDLYVWEYNAPEAYDEYSSGQSIDSTSTPIQLFYKYKTHRKTDYLAGIFSFPIISSRFRQLLVDAGTTSLDFHPVKLICQKTKVVDNDYSFLNILDNIACFDWNKSEFERGFIRQDVVREVRKLKIIEEKLARRDLVRMKEIPSAILISNRLCKLIESAKMTGVKFQRIDEFIMP